MRIARFPTRKYPTSRGLNPPGADLRTHQVSATRKRWVTQATTDPISFIKVSKRLVTGVAQFHAQGL